MGHLRLQGYEEGPKGAEYSHNWSEVMVRMTSLFLMVRRRGKEEGLRAGNGSDDDEDGEEEEQDPPSSHET